MRDHDGFARVLIPFDRREGMSLAMAAGIAGKSETTVRDWCKKHSIGRRIAGGNWTVSRVALAMLLDGNRKALQAYHAGIRAAVPVAPYYARAGLQELLQLSEFQK